MLPILVMVSNVSTQKPYPDLQLPSVPFLDGGLQTLEAAPAAEGVRHGHLGVVASLTTQPVTE